MTTHISRRFFLASACCAAAAPIVTPVSFAAVPGENRLLTIVLRGAMDGLALLQPYGDPLLAQYRPKLALDPGSGLIDLDGFYGLNPEAKALLPLWKAGELAFVNAISTPYRSGRSHFDGQDMLESGGASVADEKTGWLNRAIATIPRSEARKAIDVNTTSALILTGPNPADVWSTRADLDLAGDEVASLVRLYRNDPEFAAAMQEATKTDMSVDDIYEGANRGAKMVDIAKLAAGMLSREYRIASFSVTGWDTHIGQVNTFRRPVRELCDAILSVKTNMPADVWQKTAILAITEFGRTARENGSGGTDHGTGGLAILAGGAVKGGKVYGEFPGLAENRLLDGRDLMPTTDLRQLAGAMLHQQFGVTAGDIGNTIVPGMTFDRSASYLR